MQFIMNEISYVFYYDYNGNPPMKAKNWALTLHISISWFLHIHSLNELLDMLCYTRMQCKNDNKCVLRKWAIHMVGISILLIMQLKQMHGLISRDPHLCNPQS